MGQVLRRFLLAWARMIDLVERRLKQTAAISEGKEWEWRRGRTSWAATTCSRTWDTHGPPRRRPKLNWTERLAPSSSAAG
jgi:hypothetical protein